MSRPVATTRRKNPAAPGPNPRPRRGGSFDGAQIALFPIADVAHIVHGPIGCAGSSRDNRGTRSSGITLFPTGMTTDLTETDVVTLSVDARLREGQTMHRADILIAGGGRNLYTALKARIPFLDTNQEQEFAYGGYQGMAELAKQLALTMESSVWQAVRKPAPWAGQGAGGVVQ